MSVHPSRTSAMTSAGVASPGGTATVSAWYDATTLVEADLSHELAGKRVVPFMAAAEGAVMYEPGIAGSFQGTPGFLFTGDDGDSLWFWPEGESVAFRFEPDVADGLRGALSESVHRLVCQGALVFCYEERLSANGDPVFHFPELGLRAA